jgi:DNA-binding HxlR family transcriptional regulator
MQRQSFAQWPCSVARIMDLLGDPWTPLVVRDAFHGITRFDDFQRSLGIARNTLADRLKKLVDGGLLRTELYQQNPPRNEYLLTEMGSDFFPVMAAMVSWGDRWLDGGLGPPIVLRHEVCDHAVQAEVTCAHCHEPLQRSNTEFRIGSGYPAELAEGVPDIRDRFPADA